MKPRKIKCKAKSKRTGLQCGRWAVQGYEVCPMHGANHKNPGGGVAGNKLAMKHGAYINELLDDREKVIYQEFHDSLHEDFEFNKSSDRMAVELACMFFVRLLRALRGGDAEDVYKIDLMLSKKLAQLKATKEKREGDTINLRTSPAEWAAALLEKYPEEKEEAEKTQK